MNSTDEEETAAAEQSENNDNTNETIEQAEQNQLLESSTIKNEYEQNENVHVEDQLELEPIDKPTNYIDLNKQEEFTVATTATTQANIEPTATVKFVLIPQGQIVTLACLLKTSIGELRLQFAEILKMEPHQLKFLDTNESNLKSIFSIVS
jgi:hypothetical protein